MTGSKVPGALAALADLVRTATGANVIYGEPPQGQPGDFIAIAHSDQGEGVVNNQAIVDAAIRSSVEDFDINSIVVCWQGDTDALATVSRAYALLDQIDAAVLADRTLGGTAMLAQRTASVLRPMQTDNGAMTVLTFTVRVQAQR